VIEVVSARPIISPQKQFAESISRSGRVKFLSRIQLGKSSIPSIHWLYLVHWQAIYLFYASPGWYVEGNVISLFDDENIQRNTVIALNDGDLIQKPVVNDSNYT